MVIVNYHAFVYVCVCKILVRICKLFKIVIVYGYGTNTRDKLVLRELLKTVEVK